MGKTKEKQIDWGLIWYFFQSYKVRTFWMFMLVCLTGLLETANLAAVYPIMNYGLDIKDQHFILGYFDLLIEALGFQTSFLSSCILLIAISVVAVISKLSYYYFSNKLMMMIVGDYQKKTLDQLIRADYNFYVKRKQGDLIYTGTVAPDRASSLILYTIRLLYDFMSALFLLGLLMVLSWQGTVLFGVIGLLYGLFVKKIIDKMIFHSSVITVEENKKKNVILNEFITGIKAIKIFNVFKDWKDRYTRAVDESLWQQFKMLMGRALPDSLVRFVFFSILAIGGIALSQTPPDQMMKLIPVFGTFAIVASRLFPALQLVGNEFMALAHAAPFGRIVYDLCSENVQSIEEGEKELKTFERGISFEDVSFQYSQESGALLKGVSFTIERKKMTAIVGPSGSGKTTIINLLLRLYQVQSGHIKIDGVSIGEFTNDSFLSRFGYVSQETFIFHSSIRDNIRFGMENCTEEMIVEAAKQANAHEFIVQTEKGYDTIVGDAGIKLSGGQRQRIAIARAMLRKPEIIILDEATSSLDNVSEKKVQEAINQISKNTTVLVIAHRLSTVQNADKIIILDKGHIREQGTHAELLENKDVYYKLYTAKDEPLENIMERS